MLKLAAAAADTDLHDACDTLIAITADVKGSERREIELLKRLNSCDRGLYMVIMAGGCRKLKEPLSIISPS